jgi:hypothetical protein
VDGRARHRLDNPRDRSASATPVHPSTSFLSTRQPIVALSLPPTSEVIAVLAQMALAHA